MSEALKKIQAEMDELKVQNEKLAAFGTQAQAEGDTETFEKIKTKMAGNKQAIEARMSVIRDAPTERDEGVLSNLAVGAGRGAMDLLQGGKKLGLMAGEAMGLADEGSADEYAAQVSDEKARYKADLERDTSSGELDSRTNWAAGAGRIAAQAAPGAVMPGALAGRALGQIGLGAAEGALLSEESDIGGITKDALMGAGLGAAGAAIPAVARGRLPKVKAGSAAEETLDKVATLVDDAGNAVTVPPAAISDNPLDALAHGFSEIQILADPVSPALKAQRKAQGVLENMGESYGGDLGKAVQRQTEIAEKGIEGAYQKAYQSVGDMKIQAHGPFTKKIRDIIDVESSTITNPKAVKDLQRILRKAPGAIYNESGELIGHNPASVKEWHDFTSRIGHMMAEWGAPDRNWNTAPLQDAYWAARDNITRQVGRRNEVAGDLLHEADILNKNHMDMLSDIRLKDLRSNEILSKARTLGSTEQAQNFVKQLDPKGREELMGNVLSDIVNESFDAKQGMNFTVAGGRAKKYETLIQGMKAEGMDPSLIEGVREMTDFLATAKTKMPDFWNTLSGIVVSSGVTLGLPRMIMRDTAMRSMIKKLGQIPPGSVHRIRRARLQREIATRISSTAARQAGIDREGEPLQIEIRDGVPE